MAMKTTVAEKYYILSFTLKRGWGDFPGGPVIKNPLSNTGDVSSIPGGELRSHMLQGN